MNSRLAVVLVAAVMVAAGVCVFLSMDQELAWPEDGTEFTERSLDAYMYSTSEDKKESITVRFYEDAPDIPFVDITDYYQKLQKESIKVSHEGDGVFKLDNTKKKAGTASLDTVKGTLTSDDYTKFISITNVNSSSSDDDGIPFLKSKGKEVLENAQQTVVDLAGYGVKIHTDREGRAVWMPLETVADLFISPSLYYIEYVGSAVYFMDVRTVMENAINLRDPGFLERFIDNIEPEVSQGYAEFRYNEICLQFDVFYGKPGLGILSDLLAEKGLDQALAEYDDNTRKIREYMMSTDTWAYITGLSVLGNYLFDGGHTSTTVGFNSVRNALLKMGEEGVEILDYIEELRQQLDVPPIPDRDAVVQVLKTERDRSWTEMEEIGGGMRYFEHGDTAVVVFDNFTVDFEGWQDYYDGKGNLPVDTIGCITVALREASANPEIKNFLLDLSTNSGGYVADVLYILSVMIADDTAYENLDTLTKAVGREIVLADVNLDRKVDERDHDRIYDFNYGLLTSSCSFSSGNMLPVLAKAEGIMILGETSGGGSCSVMVSAAPDSLIMSLSSYNKCITGYGTEDYDENTVEKGAKPDLELVRLNPDQTKDYSGMYDIDLISEKMNEFYASA